jgi:hypothetical protein
MNPIVSSIRGEYVRYKTLAESAAQQLSDAEILVPTPEGGNSVAILFRHLGGNLRSRFTDFLTSDGEKPWRKRDEEFRADAFTRAELLTCWERGWAALFEALDGLHDADLARTITIRGQPLRVDQALHRSLAHAAYHVGQIVLLARSFRGDAWRYLSVPPGKSEEYNANPTSETAEAHAARLRERENPHRV